MSAFAIPSPFAWDTSFDVKSSTLNEQHKQLFTLIADLDAHRDDAHKAKLAAAVVAHFKTEEDLFGKHSYSESASHKATHDKFLDDFSKVGAVGDAEVDFAKKWLVNHIKASDFKYVDFLHSHGVA